MRARKIGVSSSAMFNYVQSRIPDIHFQTVNNAKDDLLKEGIIEKVPEKFGYYRLVDKKKEG